MNSVKYNSILLLSIGIVSYLYLYLSLLNKKYNIIFIYFTLLFIGYLTIGKNIYKYNLLIIIIDIINNIFILKEGNSVEKTTLKMKNNPEYTENSSNVIEGVDTNEEDADDLSNTQGNKLKLKSIEHKEKQPEIPK